MVLHELNLAARVADYLVAMKDGSIVAQGEAHDVLTRVTRPLLPVQLSHPKKPPLISDEAPITVGYWKTGRTES
ncbi:Hemin import ATP-binding protein HmuV [Mycobacterium tuberculosis]|nr:Hemin import ATP-binding protein HmuV [Mycobacterium tuberculosis]